MLLSNIFAHNALRRPHKGLMGTHLHPQHTRETSRILSSLIKADEGFALNTPKVSVTVPFTGVTTNWRGELTRCHLPDALLIIEEEGWKEDERERERKKERKKALMTWAIDDSVWEGTIWREQHWEERRRATERGRGLLINFCLLTLPHQLAQLMPSGVMALVPRARRQMVPILLIIITPSTCTYGRRVWSAHPCLAWGLHGHSTNLSPHPRTRTQGTDRKNVHALKASHFQSSQATFMCIMLYTIQIVSK